ncbi:ribonuclease H-like domain-containing protein [Tanacetum coccineum]
MNALADTGASVSVLPFNLYKNLGRSDPRPYHSNLTMADNTQAKVMGEVRNVGIQIRYQAYLVDFLVLDISVDKELPLLLGRPFLRTCGVVIDIGREDDWLSCFEVGRDEDGNHKHGPVAPSFLDIEDEMERALAMEAYFNPFKNIIVFKKLNDFLGSLPVQLKNTDWGNEGYEMYNKIEGDEAWHAKFEKATQSSHPNPLIANYEKRNGRGTIEYQLQQVKNANLKWRELPSMERHAYYYSWERALSIEGDVYPEWCSDFFSTMYFERGVDRTKLMTENSIWFRLCGQEHVLTLLEFAVLLGLYEESELDHRLFAIHFSKLEIDDKLFNHDEYWQKIKEPTRTNPRTSLIKEPLMRVVHRLIVGALAHRLGSKERCQKIDLWMMSALKESHGINLAWVIAEHLFKHALGLKENSLICGGHYVTKIAKSLGYLLDEKVAKCSEPIECEKWTEKMLAGELDLENYTLLGSSSLPLPPKTREQRQDPSGLNSSWGDWNTSLNEIERGNVYRDSMLMRNNYMLEHSMPILYHLADQANYAYPTYVPPNVPPYPYPYVPYPYPYTHYPSMGSMPSLGGTSIVPTSGYEVGGSSRAIQDDDDASMSE